MIRHAMTKLKAFTYVLPVIVFVACHTQHGHIPHGPIDTAQLFNPSGDSLSGFNTNMLYAGPKQYFIKYNDSSLLTEDTNQLSAFIKANLKTILSNQLEIVVDSSKKFDDILDLIDFVKAQRVSNYRVYYAQEIRKLLNPIALNRPSATRFSDADVLKIFISKESYKLKLHSDSIFVKNQSETESFLAAHQNLKERIHVVLYVDSNLSMQYFVTMMKALKKYNFKNTSMELH